MEVGWVSGIRYYRHRWIHRGVPVTAAFLSLQHSPPSNTAITAAFLSPRCSNSLRHAFTCRCWTLPLLHHSVTATFLLQLRSCHREHSPHVQVSNGSRRSCHRGISCYSCIPSPGSLSLSLSLSLHVHVMDISVLLSPQCSVTAASRYRGIPLPRHACHY